MTHAGMRHHFPTKLDLLEAVLQWREQDDLERARRDHPTGLGVIRAWIDSVAGNTGRPVLVELEATLSAEAIAPDHPAHDYFKDLYGRAEELLKRAFSTAARRGELRNEITPTMAARMLLSTTLGLQSLWLRNRTIDVASELNTYVRMILTADLPDRA
jgi:AcrR family transcriptional regulator